MPGNEAMHSPHLVYSGFTKVSSIYSAFPEVVCDTYVYSAFPEVVYSEFTEDKCDMSVCHLLRWYGLQEVGVPGDACGENESSMFSGVALSADMRREWEQAELLSHYITEAPPTLIGKEDVCPKAFSYNCRVFDIFRYLVLIFQVGIIIMSAADSMPFD